MILYAPVQKNCFRINGSIVRKPMKNTFITAIPAEDSVNRFLVYILRIGKANCSELRGRIAVLPLTIPHRARRNSLQRELLIKYFVDTQIVSKP